MGGREASSATVKQSVSRFRMLFGDRRLKNLRSKGASAAQIAGIYSGYRKHRAVLGTTKTQARVAAYKGHGF